MQSDIIFFGGLRELKKYCSELGVVTLVENISPIDSMVPNEALKAVGVTKFVDINN